ncbi:MAG: multiprotein-bridging factor 1 family protein [Candidatus Woesearchaeota archaeon]
MLCEICNRTKSFARCLVEGAELWLCKSCSRFGKVLTVLPTEAVKKSQAKPQSFPAEKKAIERVVSDFGEKLRITREKTGLTQKEFASRIAVRESVLRKFENGELLPELAEAKRLERLLRIPLTEMSEPC